MGIFISPMECDLLGVLLLGLVAATQTQGGVISANDVIELVKTQDPSIHAAREAVGLAEAARIEAGLYPNPSLAWEREQRGGGGEDTFVFNIPLDLSTTRSTQQHLVDVAVATAQAQASRVKSRAVLKALTLFYELMGQERQGAIKQRALARLAEASRVIRRRRTEGNASGYAQSRIAIQAELAASALRQTQAKAKRLHNELRHLLGITAHQVSFGATLEPDHTITVEAATQPKESQVPSLRSLRAANHHAENAHQAASWSWLPSLTLTGGPILGTKETDSTGYEIGIAVELPLFSHGQELSARSSAQKRYTNARSNAANRQAHLERSRARELLSATKEEMQRFKETTSHHIKRLNRAAESGYREGQLSIVELLDAQQTRTKLELRELELKVAVKQAEVSLCGARGEYE